MDKIKRINEHLKRHGYTGPVNIYEWSDNEIVVCISWGDWKHDHAYVKYLLGLMGYEQVDEPTITEQNGSDCFSAEYLFKERSDYRYIAAGSYEGELRDIAKAIRAGDTSVIKRAADILAPLIKDTDCIVPMPSRDGSLKEIHFLCHELSRRLDIPVLYMIKTKKDRPSMCEAKHDLKEGKAERLPYPEELMMVRSIIHPLRPVIIDNVIASGTTAVAALNAIGLRKSYVLALADDTNCEKITNFNK